MNKNSKYLIVFFFLIVFCCFKIYVFEKEKQVLKLDQIELSNASYGFFNVDIWEEKFYNILSKKIDEFQINEGDRKANFLKISSLLESIINEFETNYKSNNIKKSFLGVSYKNIGVDLFSIFEELKNNIPSISNTILDFFEIDENKYKLKSYLNQQLKNFTRTTFSQTDYYLLDKILEKYGQNSIAQSQIEIDNKIEKIDSLLKPFYILLILIVISSSVLFYNHKMNSLDIILISIISLVLLFLGISLPLIDIDARIKLIEFNFIGEKIKFSNQVLYFKSKSLIQVCKLMLSNSESIQTISTGMLLFFFSFILPVIKTIFSLFFIITKKVSNNNIINTIVFKSGKWSMADVMVVSILISYLGFSGIVSSQISNLETLSDGFNVITSNQSKLNVGFFFFTGYVLSGLIISNLITKIINKNVS